MNERTKQLKEFLKNSYLWEKLEKAFGEQNRGLTDEMLELYVYVIDAYAPDKLAAISKQYMVLQDIAKNNFSDYREICDNVEAFLLKLLYIVDSAKWDNYSKENKKGLVALYKYLELTQQDYFEKTASGAKKILYKTFRSVSDSRNENTHEAPINQPEKITEMIWQSLFVELWAVRQYKDELIHAKNNFSDSQYEEVVALYRNLQITEYEKNQEKGFQYIQIEYENTQDPENDNEGVDFKIVKGTAETLMQSINFEETPSIKLVAEAGMGKTKMLEYINYMLMRDMASNDGTVFPLLIYCNDTMGDLINYSFEDTVLGKMKAFLKQQHQEYVPEKGLLEYILQHYKVMYLLDGLNEINKSNSDKRKFINSLKKNIESDTIKGSGYYLMTERYSRGATTIKSNVVYYKLSEISDDIKKEFFKAKGAETLFKRLDMISNQYDSETQKELNVLLRRPFYLSVFCELSDSLGDMDNAKLPRNKQELMDFFVKELIKRENAKGEIAANYMYIKLFLMKLAELLSSDHRIILTDALRGFSQITQEYGLDNQEYSSNHVIELFEQLGFIRCSDEDWIYVDDIYADYMDELLLESL